MTSESYLTTGQKSRYTVHLRRLSAVSKILHCCPKCLVLHFLRCHLSTKLNVNIKLFDVWVLFISFESHFWRVTPLSDLGSPSKWSTKCLFQLCIPVGKLNTGTIFSEFIVPTSVFLLFLYEIDPVINFPFWKKWAKWVLARLQLSLEKLCVQNVFVFFLHGFVHGNYSFR